MDVFYKIKFNIVNNKFILYICILLFNTFNLFLAAYIELTKEMNKTKQNNKLLDIIIENIIEMNEWEVYIYILFICVAIK